MSGDSKKDEFFRSVGEVVDEVVQDETGVRNSDAADEQGHPVQEIESLCMKCHENGTTRLLFTSIPYFREIILMSFECPHCNFMNSEIQSANKIQEKGTKYTLKLESRQDFDRQVIKSETAVCKFLELDLEIPPKSGKLTTVEGLLKGVVTDLSIDQDARKTVDEKIYQQIEDFITRVNDNIACAKGTLPLTFILDDPAGNSWIEYKPGDSGDKWFKSEYVRSDEENVFVGILTRDQLEERRQKEREELSQQESNPSQAEKSTFLSDATDIEDFQNEVQTFTASCPSCVQSCNTNMKSINIPHFKEVIIISTVCDHCGYKSNDVKVGGEIPAKGRIISLICDSPEDLSRDILKSETCTITIPELNLDIQQGTLGGRFTTLEGLLTQVYEELESRVFTQTCDSMDQNTKERWQYFFNRLKQALNGKLKFTLVMQDPLASSYIQNLYAPDTDPNITIEEYYRTEEQNEDLGLNDMDVGEN